MWSFGLLPLLLSCLPLPCLSPWLSLGSSHNNHSRPCPKLEKRGILNPVIYLSLNFGIFPELAASVEEVNRRDKKFRKLAETARVLQERLNMMEAELISQLLLWHSTLPLVLVLEVHDEQYGLVEEAGNVSGQDD